jgi:serine/threonine protein kinase
VNYRLLTHANFKSRSTSLAEMIRAKPNRAGVTEEMRFIDLIEKMITYNVNERLTPQEALLHPFFHSMVDVGVNTDLTMFPQKPQQR